VRLPLSKVYRAFPELDRFSDDECELYVRHVSRDSGTSITVGAFAVAIGSMIVVPVVTVLTARLVFVRPPTPVIALMSLLVFGGLFSGPLWGFLFRDRLLRRAVLERLKRARCPACRYSLVGLKSKQGRVTCPECGSVIELAATDLTEQDLVAERA